VLASPTRRLASSGEKVTRYALVAALVTSLVLLGLRLDVARLVGLGDAEALYMAYGLHPQPAYLDNPGLIGWVAGWLGPDASPTAVHVFTALASTLLPWAGVLAARAMGAAPGSALRSYFPLALIPELSIGSFAFTPNLLLCFCWLWTLGCAGWALRHPPAQFGTLLASLGAGAGAALGCLSKTSGWLLAAALLGVCLARSQAPRWKTLAPWAACVSFGILVAPLVQWWLGRETIIHLEPHPAWQQVMRTLLRPVVSASPPFLFAAFCVGRDLLARERRSAVDRLLQVAWLAPLLPLALLGVYSSADADWLTPAYLTLSLHAARSAPLPPRLIKSSLALGAAVALLSWCWIRTDLPEFTGRLFGGYAAAEDPSNDFYAWGPGRQLLDSAVMTVRERTGQTPLVIGPHWAVCAQAEVALGGRVHVACDSLDLDDYDKWSDPRTWGNALTILFVTDSRFRNEPPDTFYGRARGSVHEVSVERFGRSVRRISVTEFDREEGTAQAWEPSIAKPARSSRARSSAASGFGVVSNLSP
jgi:hypothetical protein